MRLRCVGGATAALLVGLLAAACDNGPKNPIDTGLCDEPGSTVDCPVATDSAWFTITLVSTSCTAKGTTITVTEPIAKQLTGDACYESNGKEWRIGSANSGFPAGTQLNFTITSDQTASAPTFHLTGIYPDWTINFEDGGDTDFNDVVLQVHASAVTD
jgi:hypothetical protein